MCCWFAEWNKRHALDLIWIYVHLPFGARNRYSSIYHPFQSNVRLIFCYNYPNQDTHGSVSTICMAFVWLHIEKCEFSSATKRAVWSGATTCNCMLHISCSFNQISRERIQALSSFHHDCTKLQDDVFPSRIMLVWEDEAEKKKREGIFRREEKRWARRKPRSGGLVLWSTIQPGVGALGHLKPTCPSAGSFSYKPQFFKYILSVSHYYYLNTWRAWKRMKDVYRRIPEAEPQSTVSGKGTHLV